MAEMYLLDEETEDEVHEVPMNIPPWNGDVVFQLLPKSRKRVLECQEKAKRNRKYNRHTVRKDGRPVTVDGNPDEAFVEELAKTLVVGWSGIVNKVTKEPIPCTEETKIKLFNNTDVANWIVKVAGELASVGAETDEKN